MRTIAIMNPKGGTGKSITTYAMSCILAEQGFKVLAVDADWQGALSEMSGVDAQTCKVSIPGVLSEDTEVSVASLEVTEKGFSLIPCRPAFCKERGKYKRTVLREVLSRFQDSFDFCVIDAPPYTDMWGENILMAAQQIIVPEHMGVLGYRYLKILNEFIQTIKENGNPGLSVTGILHTENEDESVENSERKQLLKEASVLLGTKVFDAEIRYDERLDRARLESMGKVLFHSYVGDDYKAFVAELLSPA